MTETICGKLCSECSYKRDLSCPGCRLGPGSEESGTCSIARCCRSSRRENCQSCAARSRCANLQSRERIPKDRLRHRKEEQGAREDFLARGRVLRKLILVLFALSIPDGIASILSGNLGAFLGPSVQLVARAAGMVLRLVMGILLLKMGSEKRGYNAAGWCFLGSVGLGSLPGLLPAIAGTLLLLLGEYRLYATHESLMEAWDEVLAYRWGGVWKWRALICADAVGNALVIAATELPGLFYAVIILAYALYLAVMALGYILVLCQMWERRRGEDAPSRTVVVFHGKLPIRLIHVDYFGTVLLVVLIAAFGLLKYATLLVSLITAAAIPLLLLKTARALPKDTTL